MKENIIGRARETEQLQAIYNSGNAEFTVVYGRRRVGKTFLVREYFEKDFAFYHTALSPFELTDNEELLLSQQLQSFHSSLKLYGDYHDNSPKNWIEAFDWLRDLLIRKSRKKRLVVFIDELPWLDTPRSGFVTAFEHFWNGWGAGQKKLLLIVCGSATSWISDQLLNNTGGLYGRTTKEISVSPFTLKETEQFLKSKGIVYNHYDILETYMVMGGIPYYLSYMEKGMSVAQNIDNIFLKKGGKLENEFIRLFSSLFVDYERYISFVRFLSQKRKGFTRKEIAEHFNMTSGGGLSKILQTLCASDFVMPYVNFDHSSREVYYKLTDFFSLFYFYFIDNRKTLNPSFWQENSNSPSLKSWRGFSFEEVCFMHQDKIKAALGISGIHTEVSSWMTKNKEENAQIDMLIVRDDRIVNICEMKFHSTEVAIDKDMDKNLRNKMDVFMTETKCKKTPQIVLVTTYGLKQSLYGSVVQKVVTMDDLF